MKEPAYNTKKRKVIIYHWKSSDFQEFSNLQVNSEEKIFRHNLMLFSRQIILALNFW